MTALAAAEPGRPRTLTWLVAASLAVVAVIAADHWRDAGSAEAPLDPADLRPGFGPRTYAEALAGVELRIVGAREQVARNPDEWLRMEVLARALFARHRLTGSADDLLEADRLLDRAMAASPSPAGPNLTRAAVSLAGHNLAAAEIALERMEASAFPLSEQEQLEGRSIRCEIAFQRGQLAEAERLCAGSDDLGLELRRANIAAKRGNTDEAALIIEGLMRRPGLSPATLAQLALQRASVALAAGDWEASGRWVRAAGRIFPGHWLSEAFLAQQQALEGKVGEARRRYEVIERSNLNPDVMEALAALARAQGDAEEEREWIALAGGQWIGHTRVLPGAYRSHMVEHLLAYGEPDVALTEARKDYADRPFSTPATNLARALLLNGQAGEALAVLRDTERRGFRTAALKIEEYRALVALRRMDQARIARQQAFALNPMIEDPRQRFVFFDQD